MDNVGSSPSYLTTFPSFLHTYYQMKPPDFKHIVKESLREAFYTKNYFVIGVTDNDGENTRAIILPERKPDGDDYSGDELEHNTADLHFTSHDARWKFSNFNSGSENFKNKVIWTSYNGDGPTEEQKYSVESYLQKNGFTVKGHTDWGEDILNEGINGHKITVNYYGKQMPAILSKNTIPGEKPYRVSFFDILKGHVEARGHFDLTKQEAEEVLQNRKFPDEVIVIYKGISVRNIDGWPKQDDINENLLLLENSSREIDLWLENKNVIVESMNMVVSGANYKRTDRLDELVNYLQDTVVSPVLRGMTDPAQIDFFHKNSVGFYNLLSADGSYYEMQSGNPALGIINFYPAGIPADMARRVMMGMLKQLKKLGVQWGQLKREKSGAYKVSDVIRIPITVNNSKGYEGPEELNFTNVNAYQIFHNLLQFDGEHSFEMDAKELMERIETVLKHDRSWIDKNVIKRTDSDWPEAERDTEEPIENPHLDIMGKIGNQLGAGGARVVGMGLDSEGIEFRLQLIWKVAKWAVDHGHNKIYVG